MTIRLAAPLALLVLSCAAPAFAAAGGNAEQQAEPAAASDDKPKKERRVCRNETATGSVMPKRVCRTVEQMEEDERRAEEYRDRENRMGGAAR
jgi:hypothetical protein